jgi:peptide-methionine (S)-S-oxide reductase
MRFKNQDIDKNYLKKLDQIYFGMGCFWGAERAFWSAEGVYTTFVGYAGGDLPNPSYEDICTGNTGHAEIVQVLYDKSFIKLNDLLKIFWESHDPTQINGQGNDHGTQYRSAIYTANEHDFEESTKSKIKFQKIIKNFGFGEIQTEIAMLNYFYLAEEYHQKYLNKNPNGYCGLKGLGIYYD